MTLTRRLRCSFPATSVATAALLFSLAGCASSPLTAARQKSTVTSTPTTSATIYNSGPALPAVSTLASPATGLTVSPGSAAVGDTVTITSQTTCGAGASSQAALAFLGPLAYVGPGGGGDGVMTTPTGTGFSASYRIPSSYAGGEQTGASGLTLPVAPGSGYEFASYPAAGCTIPFTVAPSASGMAGEFADTWHFHVTTLSIASDGEGAVTWRDTSLCETSSGCYGATAATFVLREVTGTSARAVIQASNDPAQLPVGTSLTLTLLPDDTLSVSGVSAASPYYNTRLCGSRAALLSVAQQQAAGISCGA
jgi:hypothetical protein